jgi:hypothetical protein
MPFKYSCFISYCHGKEALVKTFIEELKQALKYHLDAYLDEEVYIDEERLRGGVIFTMSNWRKRSVRARA